MSNSYTPPDRSTYDPGWNDPPSMLISSQAPVVVKPRTSLNKRVAFPMQSSVATSSSVETTAEGLPLPFSTAKYQPPLTINPLPEMSSMPQNVLSPPPAPPPSTILSSSESASTTSREAINEHFDPETAKHFSNSVFIRLVDAMGTNNTDTIKTAEIRKRIEVLDQMWQENKLSDAVQIIIYQLAKDLENNDIVAALEQQRKLATQHINVSTQWATAMRQIILSISPESILNVPNAPAEIPEIEFVNYEDWSSKPIVMECIPSLPIEPQNSIPLAVSNQQRNDNNSMTSTNVEQSTNEDVPKSRFGRIGRILHI